MEIFKKKDREKDAAEEKDYEYMLIRHKRRMGFLVFLLIVLGAVALFAVKIFLDNRAYDSYEITNTINMGDTTRCKFYKYGEGVLRYSNDGISYMVGDTVIWNQAFEMKNPVVDVCGTYMAIADIKGTKVYIYDTEGQQGELQTSYPILDLEVAGQGVVAAITQSDVTNMIELYDKEGENIAKGQTVLSGDGCPLDISLSNDGTKLVVSYVYIDGSVAKTKVIFYNYSEVGKNEVGRIVGGFEHYETSIISKVEFVTNDVAVAFGDDVVSIYEIKQQPALKKEIKLDAEVESIIYNNKYIGLIQQSKVVTGQHFLKIYDLAGKLVLDKTIDFAYTDVQIQDKLIIFNNLERMYVITVDDVIKYNDIIKEGIVKIIPKKAENVYMIINNKEAEEIKLK